MLERMVDQQFLLYVLTGVSAFVLLQKIIVTLIYGHLKRQTDNLPNANGRWVRQMKQKFETTYRISKEETNVEVFVDRQVAKLRFFKIGLHGLETFYRKAQLICILLGGCSYILAARAGKTTADCNAFFAMGLMAALFLQLLDNLSGNRRSDKMIRANLRDYLENMLMPKLARGEATDRYMEAPAFQGAEAAMAAESGVHRESYAGELKEPFGGPSLRKPAVEEMAAAEIRPTSYTSRRADLSREEEQRIVQDVLKQFLT